MYSVTFSLDGSLSHSKFVAHHRTAISFSIVGKPRVPCVVESQLADQYFAQFELTRGSSVNLPLLCTLKTKQPYTDCESGAWFLRKYIPHHGYTHLNPCIAQFPLAHFENSMASIINWQRRSGGSQCIDNV